MPVYDLHVHSNVGSLDGKLSPEELVDIYVNAGYSGIVLTDHYDENQLHRFRNLGGLYERNTAWLNGYYRLRRAAENTELIVECGMEYHIEAPNKASHQHILLYGDVESNLRGGRIYPYMTIEKLCEVPNVLLIQAHPYRLGECPVDPVLVDGYEIWNTRSPENVHNDLAVLNCDSGIRTGGSDTYELKDAALGGIITEEPIRNIYVCLMYNKYKVKGV